MTSLRNGMTPVLRVRRLCAANCVILLGVFLALKAGAQWLPDGPPQVLEQQFISTGGITYFRLVGLLPAGYCCQRIAGSDIARQGPDFSQIIEHETWGGPCIAMPCGARHQELVSVLGALSPGSYNLGLSAKPGPAAWETLSFTVPTNSTPTLTPSVMVNPTGRSLLIHVTGVSNVVYVLEYSATLTHWTSVKTNVGAPVIFSVPITNAIAGFFRALILPVPLPP
jgi:hypothetical protein